MSERDFNKGMSCGALLMAVILIPLAIMISVMAYSSLRDEAVKAGVAHWIVNEKTGVTEFEFIKN